MKEQFCQKEKIEKLKEMPKRYPVDGTFELTVRCNLHCKMCLFRHHDRENRELMEKELTAEQWIQMAGQAAQAGTFQLLITGGEPLLRKDFCQIWEGIYKQGFLLTLYTNATLVTEKVMETLRRYPPNKIGITIYGASAATYEKVCGDSQAFSRTLEGIRLLRTLPSKIEFRTTIIKENYGDIDAMEELIHKNFGPEYILTQTRMVTKAVRGGCADVAACRLEPEDNVRLAFRRGIQYIKQRVGPEYDEKNLHLKWEKNEGEDVFHPKLTLFGCDAGMSQYTIAWDGKLLACQMMGAFQTDALREGLAQAWKRFPYVVHLPKPDQRCENCEDRKICNCCAASRYAETGSISGCPEYVCRDTAVIKRLLEEGGIQS